MREIKFRAWLKDRKEMVNVSSLHLGTRKIIYGYSRNKLSYGNASCSFDNIELMQYTGLKDKDGVKIYEGDIVVPYYVTPMGEVTEELDYYNKGTVKIKNGCVRVQKGKTWYQLNLKCEEEEIDYLSNYGELFDYKNDIAFVKVLGNIYENPKLLEEIK